MHIAKASYFLGNRLLGTSAVTYDLHPANCPDSIAYFCNTCGEVWGRVFVTDGLGIVQRWQLFNAPCERHQRTGVENWSCVPGSFLLTGIESSAMSSMLKAAAADIIPEAVLRRELEVHFRYFYPTGD